MHKVIFYPVRNGDTSQIILANGKRILFDFRHQKQGEDENNPVIDLNKRLREELEAANRDYFDVVAFTHGDRDHIAGSTDFFELRHKEKYKGGNRIKIDTLWVPAEMILDDGEREQEHIILRQEARFRLKEGEGVQVFSRPEKLESWLEKQGIKVTERLHLITDAGKLANGFSVNNDGVEFFCHSPFIKHVDDGDDLRNAGALIFQVRFEVDGFQTNYFAIGDSKSEVLEDIVRITKYHKRDDRLKWDLFNIPHHCSYLALSDSKGSKETEPKELVKELLLSGQRGAYMVSSSDPIPDNKEMYESEQPPHIQARKAYQRYLNEVVGRRLLVTMEEPTEKVPEPLEFEISGRGCIYLERSLSSARLLGSTIPPRAG